MTIQSWKVIKSDHAGLEAVDEGISLGASESGGEVLGVEHGDLFLVGQELGGHGRGIHCVEPAGSVLPFFRRPWRKIGARLAISIVGVAVHQQSSDAYDVTLDFFRAQNVRCPENTATLDHELLFPPSPIKHTGATSNEICTDGTV